MDSGAETAVDALAVAHGRLFIGAGNVSVGGKPRGRLAALDISTGSATAWAPEVLEPIANFPIVNALALADGVLYLGGEFGSVAGAARASLAAVDAESGAVLDWSPYVGSPVQSLVVYENRVLVGGRFAGFNSTPPIAFAAIDRTTGIREDWDVFASGDVRAMALDGQTLYLGGLFDNAGGQPRSNLAALDLETRQVTDWQPQATSQQVLALTVNAGVVYAAGNFSFLNGEPRKRLGAIDGTSGEVTSWVPPNVSNSQVSGIAVRGQTVSTGGAYSSDNGILRGTVGLDLLSAQPIGWGVPGGPVYAFGQDLLFAGGPAPGSSGTDRQGLFVYDMRVIDPLRFRGAPKVIEPDTLRLSVAGAPGANTRLDRTFDWMSWSPAGSGQIGGDGLWSVDIPHDEGHAFFRAVAIP